MKSLMLVAIRLHDADVILEKLAIDLPGSLTTES